MLFEINDEIAETMQQRANNREERALNRERVRTLRADITERLRPMVEDAYGARVVDLQQRSTAELRHA